MSPEQQASLLADWLRSPPGADPPPGLDPDVVEGVYALRPERAPAPRVTVEDILAGPAAEPVRAGGAAAPPLPAGDVVSLAPRRSSSMRLWAMVGTIAAAAAVLFVVVPSEREAPSVGPAPEVPALAPPAETAAKLMNRDSAAPADDAPAAQRPPVPKPQPAPRSPAVAPAEPRAAVRQQPSGPGSAPSPLTEVQAQKDAEVSDETISAPVVSGYAMGGAEAEEDLAVSELSKAEESRRDRGERATTRAAGASNVVTAEPAASAGRAVGNLSGLRASASPPDYNPSWYLSADAETAARVGARIDEAKAAISAGNRSDAVAIYAGGISDGDARAAQDFAGRAARLALDLGDQAAALRYAQQGIGRSSANTAFLARLYALQGEAYERLGDPEAAAAAYARAQSLNLER